MNADFEVLDVVARQVAVHTRKHRPDLHLACLCGWESTPSPRSARRQYYAHVAEQIRHALRDHGLLPTGIAYTEWAIATAEGEPLPCYDEDQARTEYAADTTDSMLMTRTIRIYDPTTTPWEETE